MPSNSLLDNFKETEIGPIPVEWEVVRLGDVASLTMGQSPPSSTYNTNCEGLPFLQGKAEFGETYPTPVKWCSRPQKVADRDSVLISVRAPVGDVNVAKDDYCIGRGLAAINGSGSLDNWFLFYLLIFAKRRLEDRGTGSTFKSINKGVLQNFSISLPPLPEQRRIAHVLSTIQQAIAAQDDLIAAVREMKRSLMQRLFTYGPSPEPAPTKETEIGEIPEYWGVVRLGEMAEFKNGINFRSDQKGRGILTVDVLNMYAGGIALQMGNLYRVDTDVKAHYLLQPNDILLVRSSLKQEGVGWPALFTGYTEPVTFCGFLIRARLTSTLVLPEFLVNYLRLPSARQLLVSKSGKVAITNINQGNLRSLCVCLPPLQEQGKIVKALRTVDSKIAAEEQRKAALQALFKAMLHQLMTGQLRLPKSGSLAKLHTEQQ